VVKGTASHGPGIVKQSGQHAGVISEHTTGSAKTGVSNQAGKKTTAKSAGG
jgi:hypothetical protein